MCFVSFIWDNWALQKKQKIFIISRSDPRARRDCEAGEADVGAAPASADAGPAKPQQGEARQG